MTDKDAAAVTAEPDEQVTANQTVDDRVAEFRLQRNVALQAGDRETARELDALERELYDAEAGDDQAESASTDDAGAPAFTEADHAPLTGDETAGVFGFLETVDPDAAAGLRAEWGGDAAANLGYAHLWFTTQYTQDERDSMVVTPGLVRMAARMGRKLAADGRATQTHSPGGGREPATDGGTSRNKEVGELRRRREEAQRNGDYRRAQELDAQERAAWARLHGDGPIVGHAGRTL